MPETDTIPVSASVASTGKGIRYIGQHCYAYSGDIAGAGSEITYLDFTTGSGYILATLQYGSSIDTGADQEAFLYFNNVLIYHYLHNESRDQFNLGKIAQEMLIPPRTHVKFSINTAATWSAQLVGRVYGAV